MTENKCKSLENLLPIATNKLSQTKFPIQFETYRNKLHREMAKHWPFSTNIVPITSKSKTRTSIRDGTKSKSTFDENELSSQTFPRLKSSNLTISSPTRLTEKKLEKKNRTIPIDSELSLNENSKRNEWNLKAQEGIISYQLPDGLPDGFALHTKLKNLMKTDKIYLNDRRFWTKLENQFKNLRKKKFHENMERLRQTQQQYEQELISKGIIPHTTEEAIKQYIEQQKTQIITDKNHTNNSHHKNCLIDYISSTDKAKFLNKSDEYEVFESDNVHPNLHEILTDYKYQTKFGQEIGKKFQKNLHKTQMQIKTIFPKKNHYDLLRQELESLKTSEELYSYSNRLTK